MPPQLDLVALVGLLIPEKWAALVGGGLVLVLGAALALLAMVVGARQHAA